MLHQYQYTDGQRNKQEDLARSIHSKEYDAHYAIDDVNILSELLSHLIVFDHKCVIMKSFTINDIKHSMDSNKEKKRKKSRHSQYLFHEVSCNPQL